MPSSCDQVSQQKLSQCILLYLFNCIHLAFVIRFSLPRGSRCWLELFGFESYQCRTLKKLALIDNACQVDAVCCSIISLTSLTVKLNKLYLKLNSVDWSQTIMPHQWRNSLFWRNSLELFWFLNNTYQYGTLVVWLHFQTKDSQIMPIFLKSYWCQYTIS